MTTRVAIDALGGDHAPDEIVAGAVEAATGSIEPVLYGPATLDAQGLDLVPCTEMIEMHEKPADAVRGKPDSSLVRAVRFARKHAGELPALVEAGGVVLGHATHALANVGRPEARRGHLRALAAAVRETVKRG